jgi:hypothetical protein
MYVHLHSLHVSGEGGGEHAVAQLVEALRYKPEGRGFDGVIGIFHSHNPSGRTMALG